MPLHSFGPFVRNHYLLHNIISGQGMLYSHAFNGEIYEYSLEAMRWAVEQGLVSGKGGGILNFIVPATRAEAAAMLQRYLENS